MSIRPLVGARHAAAEGYPRSEGRDRIDALRLASPASMGCTSLIAALSSCDPDGSLYSATICDSRALA